ncbi:MAG TPA: hypothetical protein VIW94_10410 [Acidimicrobiia bacterium]
MSKSTAGGVIISGLYGSGKSTVVEEIAFLLEDAATTYAAIDLDWLWWFGVPGVERREALGLLTANLASIVDRYMEVGVRHFVMAWSLRDADDEAAIRTALSFPIKVVELTVPFSLIEDRLGSAVTAGRSEDLEEARRWFSHGLGTGFGDTQVANDRPIREVALEICTWIGWL